MQKDAIAGEDASIAGGPDSFKRLCNGDAINEMVEINNRVYTQSTKMIFDILFPDKKNRHSDDEISS